MARAKNNPTSDATRILRDLAGRSARTRSLLQREREKAGVAREIYLARTTAGLSQRELAKLVGTTHSVISRLEDADYEGHSMAMLRRIAKALDRKVEVRLVPRRAA